MARRSRSRDLAGLAALGALGYTFFGPGRTRKDGTLAPVEDRNVSGAAPVVSSAPSVRYDPDAFERDVGVTDAQRQAAEREGANISEGERVAMGAADRAALRGYDDMYADRVVPAAAPVRAQGSGRVASQRLASPDADFPSAGRTRAAPAAPAAPAAAPPMSLRQQLTQTTLGTPIGPAPGAPSIYASSEARAAYRQQQAAESAAQPPTQQGSARNIVQQMREKDKAVLAAVRRRQAEEEAAAQALREAEAERRREARRVEPPAVGLDNPYYGRSGAQRTAALRAKGGAIKAKPKKMASGGMSSASKRADGIASKGKTKCKMY